jgi:hypothetical protein
MYRNQDIILKQLHCCKVNHTLLCNESIFCVA